MTTKKTKSSSTRSARNSKATPSAARPASDVKALPSAPETVLRYSGQVVCVIGLPAAVTQHLGAQLTQAILKELNETGLSICWQDDQAVVNLSTHIYACAI